jgi:hypothetical protein
MVNSVPEVPEISEVIVKQISPAKNWCFTLNNPTEIERDMISSKILDYCKIGFYADEVGDTGTPHLQGYIRFITKRRPKSVFTTDRIHWEKSKGSLEDNKNYCTKQAALSFCKGLPRVPRVYSYTDLFPEQRNIVDALASTPDDRHINVCVAGYGKGKTSLARHLVYYHDAIILPTTRRHALSIAAKNLQAVTYIIDLSADESANPDREFFDMIESLKNGLFATAFGTKGTGPVIMDFPHILIMSNTHPDVWYNRYLTDMDKDRFITHVL